jgi:hypothetical protein
MTGRADGANGQQFADYIIETLKLPDLEKRWAAYQ